MLPRSRTDGKVKGESAMKRMMAIVGAVVLLVASVNPAAHCPLTRKTDPAA